MPVSSVQFGQTPWQYANGLGLANDGTSPDTIVTIATGSILDSTGVYQLTVDSALSVDNTVSGLNGLDTGTVAASTVYAVYVVADPVTQQAIGGILSLASNSTPLLPFGYSAYALVGYIATDATSDFIIGTWTAGNSTSRQFIYDAFQATSITTGAATSYTTVALTAFVPPVANTLVNVGYAMTPSVAGRQLFLQPYGGTADSAIITGQVATVPVTGGAEVFAELNSGAPSVNYKWTAGGGDAVALYVVSYQFEI